MFIPGAGDDMADATGGSPGNADELIYLDSPRGVVIDAAAGTATGFGNDTFTGFEWYIGSDHDDTITGTDADVFEILFGAGGNDQLDGVGDDNGLAGGPGDDVLTGGPGFDILLEYFMAEYYRQPLPEGPFVVNLLTQTFTGHGDDTISGIDGSTGTQADDVMTGDAGDNEFTGLIGGADTVDAGAGDDTVDGGEGSTISTAVPAATTWASVITKEASRPTSAPRPSATATPSRASRTWSVRSSTTY